MAVSRSVERVRVGELWRSRRLQKRLRDEKSRKEVKMLSMETISSSGGYTADVPYQKSSIMRSIFAKLMAKQVRVYLHLIAGC